MNTEIYGYVVEERNPPRLAFSKTKPNLSEEEILSHDITVDPVVLAPTDDLTCTKWKRAKELEREILKDFERGYLTKLGVCQNLVRAGFNQDYAVTTSNKLVEKSVKGVYEATQDQLMALLKEAFIEGASKNGTQWTGRLTIEDDNRWVRYANAVKTKLPPQSLVVCSVATMQTSAGTDYYVQLRIGDRTLTPRMYDIKGRADFEVAEWKWFFGQAEQPDILEFDTDAPKKADVDSDVLSAWDERAIIEVVTSLRLGEGLSKQAKKDVADLIAWLSMQRSLPHVTPTADTRAPLIEIAGAADHSGSGEYSRGWNDSRYRLRNIAQRALDGLQKPVATDKETANG